MENKNGYYRITTRIKSDATPIDNITKFAWDDDDYEEAEVWHEYTAEELEAMQKPTPEQRIAELEEALELLLSGVTE